MGAASARSGECHGGVFLCTLLVTEDLADSMAYGDRKNLKSFASILSANGSTRLRLFTVRFSQKPIMCAPNICHKHRSHFQRVLVNLVPPHFRSSIVDSTIPYIGTIVKLDDNENAFLILKHSYIQLQVLSMKFNGQEFLPLQQA